MLPRVVTGLVGLPIILGLTYAGAPLFNLAVNVVGIIGGFELAYMIRPAQPLLAIMITLGIVVMPTAMKVTTAYRLVTESEAKPLIPCPEVQPLLSLVPNPTRKPPSTNLQRGMELTQKPSGEIVTV